MPGSVARQDFMSRMRTFMERAGHAVPTLREWATKMQRKYY